MLHGCTRLLHGTRGGFTLVEMLVVLVMLGAVSLLGMYLFMTATRGYVQARNADTLVQKAQMALQRMQLDLSSIESDTTSGDATSLSYDAGDLGTHTIRLSGSNLIYTENGAAYVLCDGIAADGLRFQYYANVSGPAQAGFSTATNLIAIRLTVAGDGGQAVAAQTFTTRVALHTLSAN